MTQKTNTFKRLALFWLLAKCVVTYRHGDPCPALNRDPWSYEGSSNGPRKWGKTYPMCYGDEQSPIDIDTYDVEPDSSLKKLSLVNYDVPISRADVLNNGHTVEITPRDYVRRYIEIDGTKFKLQQFHFHWSKKQGAGTEHAFDNKRFNMEGHFVHSSDQNETAVVGVLYKTVSGKNNALQNIVDVLPLIRYRDDQTVLRANVSLNGLLPSNPASFYRYQGSLTTPACNEGVSWTVLKKIFYIGNDQLSQFLKLYAVPKNEARSGCKITTNVRPLQRLNDRVVVSSQ